MDRRPLTILLAVLIAFQSSLAGFVVCSDGGCCHAEAEADHVDHDLGEVHDHSPLVNTSVPHPCDCTDQELGVRDAAPGNRNDLQSAAPEAYVLAGPVYDYRSAIASMAQSMRPSARADAADRQRLAVVRATRLLL
jgi:hypothetical protein